MGLCILLWLEIMWSNLEELSIDLGLGLSLFERVGIFLVEVTVLTTLALIVVEVSVRKG